MTEPFRSLPWLTRGLSWAPSMPCWRRQPSERRTTNLSLCSGSSCEGRTGSILTSVTCTTGFHPSSFGMFSLRIFVIAPSVSSSAAAISVRELGLSVWRRRGREEWLQKSRRIGIYNAKSRTVEYNLNSKGKVGECLKWQMCAVFVAVDSIWKWLWLQNFLASTPLVFFLLKEERPKKKKKK